MELVRGGGGAQTSDYQAARLALPLARPPLCPPATTPIRSLRDQVLRLPTRDSFLSATGWVGLA